MATIEQVLKAVEKLTETYEEMNNKLNDVVSSIKPAEPLYKNGVCYWDGTTALTAESELFGDIICHGNATKAVYGVWNKLTMLTLTQSVANVNPKTTIPVNYHILRMKVNNKTNDKKTMFIHFANADSHAHGFPCVYLVTETMEIKKWLGLNPPSKYSGEGNSLQFDMFNVSAQSHRYYEWYGYNFNLSDAYIDDEGYAYFALANKINGWFIAGWGMADRTTNYEHLNSIALSEAYLPTNISTNNAPVNDGMVNNVQYGHFVTGADYNGVEIPYTKGEQGKDLIIGFIVVSDGLYMSDFKVKGSISGNFFERSHLTIGKYGKFFRTACDFYGNKIITFRVPYSEIEENTVEYNGKTFLKVDLPAMTGERAFYFHSIYTEDME